MAHYTVREETAFIGAEEEDPRGLIEIGEDEFILDFEYRGAKRVVMAIATPVEVSYECGAETKDGYCTRTVEEPGERCWQHD